MRPPAVAGMFYPSDPSLLLSMIDDFLKQSVDFQLNGKLRAIVVPHAGYVYSGIVAAAGYKLVKQHMNEFDKVILLGPSHYVAFRGVASPGTDVWETPLGMVRVFDLKGKHIAPFPEAHSKEHSLEVQIPFLQITLPKAEYYPLVLGDVDPKSLADDLIPYMNDRTLLVISSDLSHYHPYDEAVKIDSIANDCIPKLDYDCVLNKVEACGKLGILTLIEIAKRKRWKAALVDYKNSGDTAGPKDQVVGYGCYAFYD